MISKSSVKITIVRNERILIPVYLKKEMVYSVLRRINTHFVKYSLQKNEASHICHLFHVNRACANSIGETTSSTGCTLGIRCTFRRKHCQNGASGYGRCDDPRNRRSMDARYYPVIF